MCVSYSGQLLLGWHSRLGLWQLWDCCVMSTGSHPVTGVFLSICFSGIRLGSEDRCAGGRPKKGLFLPSIPDLLWAKAPRVYPGWEEPRRREMRLRPTCVYWRWSCGSRNWGSPLSCCLLSFNSLVLNINSKWWCQIFVYLVGRPFPSVDAHVD